MKAYVEVNGSGVRASLTVSSTIASFWWKSPQVEASMEACMKASDWKSVVFSCHVLPWTCQTHPRKLLRRLSWKSTEVGSTEASTCRKLPRKLVHGTFHVPGESTEAASTEACMEKASTETSKVIFCRGLWIPVKGMGVLQNFEKFRLRVLKSQKFRALWHGRTELTEVPVGYKKCCTRTPRNVARGVQDSNMFQVGV